MRQHPKELKLNSHVLVILFLCPTCSGQGTEITILTSAFICKSFKEYLLQAGYPGRSCKYLKVQGLMSG